ncbi:MAG: efflux RND transporter permease subunit [Gammaproteobacteria bacterium]|jgi:multidrug efflux pump
MKFTDIFIKRPVLASVVSLLILMLGLRSIGLLTVRQYPKSSSAVITVSTAYPGASAELMKGFITVPLEKSIAQANGIDYLESTSAQGVSNITAHLELNYDPNKALTQITSKVNAVRNQLPPQAQAPTINVQIGQTTDDMYLAFFSDTLDTTQITDYLERVVQPELSAVAGVQKAEVVGSREFAMRIWLEPDRMAAYDITGSDIRAKLAANNYLAGIGQSKGAMVAIPMTASTQLHTAKEFGNMVLRKSHGATVRLDDVARVELGSATYSNRVRFSGHNATFVGIQVAPTANPLTVIGKIHDMMPGIRAALPPGMDAAVPYDSTRYIQNSIDDVIRTLAEALAIVVVVIFLFLGQLRSVAIPVIAMPLSLIGAAFVMLALGFSLNLLTLLAMVLAIGLVVDDAIIVVENIHRHIEEGTAPMQAALQGARELGPAVIAMSITLISVYAPIGFMGGLTGSLFTQFAFTLAGAVFISGIVALTLSPMLCSRLLKHDEGGSGRFAHWLDEKFARLQGWYEHRVHRVLEYRPVVVAFAIVVLASCYFFFVSAQQELAPTEDQGLVLVQGTGAANATLDQTQKYADQLMKILQTFKERDHIFMISGGHRGSTGANHVISGLVLKPWSERERTQMQIKPEVQAKVSQIAAFQTAAFSKPPLPGAGGGLPVQFVVGTTHGEKQLYKVTQQMIGKAYASGLFAYVASDLRYDKASMNLKIDRDRVADLGLDMQTVGSDLAWMLGGNYVNFFSISGQSYKVIPQVARHYRLNPDQMLDYHIRAKDGQMVPLSAIASLHTETIPESLKRFQQLNSATLSAIPAPGVSLGQALDFLRTQARQMLPEGYSVNYAGQSRQYVQEGSALIVTFFFAIIIIYLVLAAQFESFRDPLIILVSVPMSISGALAFVTLGFATINIYTEVGLITLIGLISKHGILIVEFANQLQRSGLSKRKAIEEAASIRLRPILMTTAAMVLGVTPLILASGAGAVSRYDMGLVIASGMAIGTLFTLFVVPTMYMILGKDLHGGAQGPSLETS